MARFVNISGIIGIIHVGFTKDAFFVNISGMQVVLASTFRITLSFTSVSCTS